MKMTSDDFEEHQADNSGYCSTCDAITSEGVEGDAAEENCPECSEPTLMGMDSAIMSGAIDVSDDDEEVGVISFSDDEEDGYF